MDVITARIMFEQMVREEEPYRQKRQVRPGPRAACGFWPFYFWVENTRPLPGYSNLHLCNTVWTSVNII